MDLLESCYSQAIQTQEDLISTKTSLPASSRAKPYIPSSKVLHTQAIPLIKRNCSQSFTLTDYPRTYTDAQKTLVIIEAFLANYPQDPTVQAYQEEIKTLLKNYPLSLEKTQLGLTHYYKAACSMLQKHIEHQRYPEALKNLESIYLTSLQEPASSWQSGKIIKNVYIGLITHLHTLFPSRSKQDINNEVIIEHAQLISQQTWDTIENSFNITHKGELLSFTSRLTPASRLGITFKGTIRGIGCYDASEPHHARNLWLAEFENTGKSPHIRLVRHGCLSAYDIDDNIHREAANDSAAKEVLAAIVLSDLELKNKVVGSLYSTPYALDVLSINLETFFSEIEHPHIHDQRDTWIRCNELPFIDLSKYIDTDRPIRPIKPVIHMFNFGVNQEALSHPEDPGWSEIDSVNDAAFQWLFGENYLLLKKDEAITSGKVGEFLSRCHLPSIPKVVLSISHDILSLRNSNSYRRLSHEPYGIIVRIIALANMLGIKVAFGYKSNKDRGSYLWAELTFFLAQLHHLTDTLKPLESPMSKSEQQALYQCLMHSGNLELQATNLGGFPGYKKDSNITLMRAGINPGSIEEMRFIRGGTDYIKKVPNFNS